MNFYTASSFRNIEDVRFINDQLIKQGHHLTYDWTQSERVDTPAALQRIGQLELDAVRAIDCMILVLPAGKGSHVELGIALASQIPIFLCMTDETCWTGPEASTFYHIDGIMKCIGPPQDWVQTILDAMNEQTVR
ncbi:group-specific protein [Exiguobacterium sp. Helios]|uniref:group-specific protein n=1 Tax=unclassified Exiguobacterium TaxID=2644629 RepID=UPI00165E7641|nr:MULTISPECIES: group-specific protein [unclassified Exiguobacterium]QNR21163.1 group-specific protein [Exiguobacterium sp. Helios]